MTRKFLIRTFGCQMNEHDSERLAAMLTADGLEATDDVDAADVVVLNTCCIRENADNRLYGQLGQLKSVKAQRPGMQIAVGGCLAQKDGGLVQDRAPQVDAVFGTHNLAAAPGLLRRAAAEGPVMEILDAAQAGDEAAFPSALVTARNLAYAAWVTIQVGCDNACAFCIVPAVRGPEVSRPFGRLVSEVEGLAGAGTTEVTLLGQNVNSYGRDITVGLRSAPSDAAADLAGERWASSSGRRARPLFADLLRAVGAVEGIRRVRFTSPHPKDLRPETIEAMAETAEVCEHLHLPLQSGSNRTLAAMHRGYTAERYLARLAEARAVIGDLAVTTDIIVGFPGETDDDFERTLEVAAEVGYDSAYTFVFSPRPGTTAAAMPERFVAAEVAAERFERLRVVVERSALARHQARVGRVEEVLIEGPSKRDPAVTTGRTLQNKLVHFPGPGGSAPGPGSYATVRVTGAAPHFLRGELVEITARPRHRSLIPVTAF
ncbi:MAG: MiaB/RimO family radical SAM methylthiotransferase [Actinomycetota bacterium]|nr:MiaB/RimO family radical SAM methylthiotransferase [Actinomycetota bacterium]